MVRDRYHVLLSHHDLLVAHRALQPPGFIKEWHVGVRVSASKRLVAFIAGIPMNLRIRQA